MSRQILVIATRNSGKLFELCELLRDLPFTLRDLNCFPSIEPVAETGVTFAENASMKARAYAQQTQFMTLADDSGLEVRDRKSTRLNSSHSQISYAVFCLKK